MTRERARTRRLDLKLVSGKKRLNSKDVNRTTLTREAFENESLKQEKKRLEGLMAPLNVSKAACLRRDGEKINKCVHY